MRPLRPPSAIPRYTPTPIVAAYRSGRLRGRLRGVIMTGAFLAEAAATVDNKLNVQGGVLSRYTVGPDRWAQFMLVVLTRADGEDSDARVTVEIRPPTLEKPLERQFEVPEASIGEFPGFAFFDLAVNLPSDGRWVIVVNGGTDVVSLPLQVSSWTPPAQLEL